ncbi:MAG: alpha-amylase family glycosyl hydrolase [Archangium sp.]
MVDRFENGDTSNDAQSDLNDPQAFHGGDIQGVINRLDWIQSLGFNTVWLSPIFKMRTEKWHGFGAFHGYWTWDLNSIEPRFGTQDTLATLWLELEKRGMKLVLDLVLNHVGPDAPMLEKHPDWFHDRGGIEDWNDPKQLVMNDVHGLPDLAVEKPEVYAYLITASKKWNAGGFRLDAVKHMPLEFWAKFNAQSGATFRLGELLDGNPDAIAKTWRDGGFTSMFDFPLGFAIADVFCRGESPTKLAAVLTNDRRYPDPSQLVTLVDNHDLPRLMSVCGGDVEKVKQALTFLFAMRGIPSMIWGTEVGLDGEKEPDNRKSMKFDEASPLKARIARLMEQRAASPALRDGGVTVLSATKDEVIFARVTKDGSAQRVSVKRGTTTIGAPELLDPKYFDQWLTGADTLPITFTGEGQLVGSGAELGDWDPKKAVSLPVTLKLPRRGVFEFKRLVDGKWEEGANRVLFVTKEETVELK